MNETNKDVRKKTEEVQDIIERMPQHTPRVVAIVVVGLAVILILFGWMVHYPESVTGAAVITAQASPVRLVAAASGKIHLLLGDEMQVEAGSAIAYLESGAEVEDVLYLESKLNINLLKNRDSLLRNDLRVGELSSYFLKFKNSIEEYQLFVREKPYGARIQQLELQHRTTQRQVDFLVSQLPAHYEAHRINTRNYENDSVQYYELKSIAEPQFLKTKTVWLSSIQNVANQEKDIDVSKTRCKELIAAIQELKVEKAMQVQKMVMTYEAAHDELKNQLHIWKQRYMFIAPCSGRLEMLNFWKENSFVQAGKEVCAILPNENPVVAELMLPSQGAGKVRIGQEVIIKLDNYPYMEYGSIKGEVESISMLTNQSDKTMAENNIHSYKVLVSLPQQLTTNYGSRLRFNHDMQGMAQILVRKRRLLERLFDNLKYMVNE